MKQFNTSQIAKQIGIHPNTVRFYEQIEFLPKIPRKENGYRIYNQLHLEQLKLIRIGLKSELLQNSLRKEVINIIKVSANENYNKALKLSEKHLENILKEQKNAQESIDIVKDKILKSKSINQKNYTRQQTADYLGLTIDTLRNWELNGLLTVKRKENGYRVYNDDDIKKLKIISSLRCANYSLSSILRLLNNLEKNKDSNENINIEKILNTPNENKDIVSVCDKLLISLENAKSECEKMIIQIKKMKKIKNTLQTNVSDI